MIKANEFYLDTLRNIINSPNGFQPSRAKYKDGTQSKTKSIYNVSVTYDIDNGEYPIQTIRQTPIKDAIKEMFWIYQDQSNDLNLLNDKYGVKYWNDWDIGDGTIGHCYGYTVNKYDLVNSLFRSIYNNPLSKRHMINLWQEDDIKSNKGLVPCAGLTRYMFQDNGNGIYEMHMTLHQRSSDFITASSLNQIQYVAFGQMIISHLNMISNNFVFKSFTWKCDDIHIYDRHFIIANEILSNENIDNTQYAIELIDNKYFNEITINNFSIPKIHYSNKSKIEVAI